MNFKILTIFPEFFENSLSFSMLKKAQEQEIIKIEIFNLRDWAKPRTVHRMVDDRPYGGGAGMVMMVEPIYNAILDIQDKKLKKEGKSKVVIFSPKGVVYDQIMASKFSTEFKELVIIVPHYEGFDERILNWVDYEICIGDFVLTGGEIPALAIIDSVSRLLPGVLGNPESSKTESFSFLEKGKRNLEHPQYTRPEVFEDKEGNSYHVPKVLLSGNHKDIEEWRESHD